MIRERLGPALVVGDFTLVPVERISLASRSLGGTVFFFGSKRPVAVVIRRGGREWRLEIPWRAEDGGEEPGAGAS